jgi:ubiquitin thioesterase protein OTUB1
METACKTEKGKIARIRSQSCLLSFRGFAFAILEHLIKNKDEFIKFKKIAEESKAKLLSLNFPQFSIEDFFETFIDVISKVEPKDNQEKVLDELYSVFNEQGYSDYVVVYLRLITSGKLQEESDFYQNFIDGSYNSVAEFCHKVSQTNEKCLSAFLKIFPSAGG